MAKQSAAQKAAFQKMIGKDKPAAGKPGADDKGKAGAKGAKPNPFAKKK